METLPITVKLIRRDFLTSAAIDHALSMQRLYGTATSRQYLGRSGIPSHIAERVLMTEYRRSVIG